MGFLGDLFFYRPDREEPVSDGPVLQSAECQEETNSCSLGHFNPVGEEVCAECGELLMIVVESTIEVLPEDTEKQERKWWQLW